MQITLLAAVSLDGFIANDMGQGNFSSPEDKAHLRFFLRSTACDCFICGRKTAREFQSKLSFKPLLTFTRTPQPPQANRMDFTNWEDLNRLLLLKGLNAPALLGGAETYAYFLENKLVDRVILTTENLRFYRGKSLDFQRFQSGFTLEKTDHLSDRTFVSYYQKKNPTRPARGTSQDGRSPHATGYA
ncbi:MAG: hypothetical protein IJ752_05050 [Alphaproteobacteria bacterium]|nr:hypothetical protein [Alphaproteobacteria bacterium]